MMSKRACLVSSTPGYNLGLEKMANWLGRTGWAVERRAEPDIQADLYAFSVIFSWDVPRIVGWVNWVKGWGRVEIGGPATTHLGEYIEKQTGVKPHIGADERFEQEPGDYKLVRTSRGCSVGCYFCVVPKMDGTTVRLYPDCSLPTSEACAVVDDNFAETPSEHRETIIKRMEGRYRLVDFNSGIEPRSWSDALYHQMRRLPLPAWRTAFDELEEEPQFTEMMNDLRRRGVRRSSIWVYVLAGGKEPFEAAKYRADRTLELGGEPRIQPYKPLTWMKPRAVPYVGKGWTREQVINLPRYYYGYYWRKMSFEKFLAQRPKRLAQRALL